MMSDIKLQFNLNFIFHFHPSSIPAWRYEKYSILNIREKLYHCLIYSGLFLFLNNLNEYFHYNSIMEYIHNWMAHLLPANDLMMLLANSRIIWFLFDPFLYPLKVPCSFFILSLSLQRPNWCFISVLVSGFCFVDAYFFLIEIFIASYQINVVFASDTQPATVLGQHS